MPFFLIPVAFIAAKAIAVKVGLVAAHHAAGAAAHQAFVAAGAHAGNHALVQGGMHVASQTINAAVVTGSIIAGAWIISTTAITALVYYNRVDKYRALNHLDHEGKRKTEFSQVDRCKSCACGDFDLKEERSGLAYCTCGHNWGLHEYQKVDTMKEEWRRYMESVGEETAKKTVKDVLS